MRMNLSVEILDTTIMKLERKYEFIPNYYKAHLLARLEMQDKNDSNKLVVILPGWNTGIEGYELEEAIKLSHKYKADYP